MTTVEKPKIEAILPLTPLQQELLFHYLSSSSDQGYLNVRCVLKGVFDRALFEQALRLTVARHEILRTTIHWKNLEKPVRIVHKELPVDFAFHDWSNLSEAEIQKKWEELKTSYEQSGPDLEKGALRQVIVVRLNSDEHRLLWPTHHILLDGWSSQLIFKDVISFYDGLQREGSVPMETLPSHASYWRWRVAKSGDDAKDFWESYFKDMGPVSYVASGPIDVDFPQVEEIKFQVDSVGLERLKNLAKKNFVTLNTLIQAAWALVLKFYFNSDEVWFGKTVSGRSADFPNLQLMTGMFMNVHPVRTTIQDNDGISELLRGLQDSQGQTLAYEYMDIGEILGLLDRPFVRPPFDSLFLFENYPTVQSAGQALEISDFRSGITSSYPITLSVIPTETLEVALQFFPESVERGISAWLLNSLELVLGNMTMEKVADLRSLLTPMEQSPNAYSSSKERRHDRSAGYAAPVSNLEKELTSIWNYQFGMESIGVHDNFFHLGGTSLAAVQLIGLIERRLNKKLPISAFLETPTIRAFARKLEGGETPEQTVFDYLVPLREDGDQTPLFCFHAGDGPVLFLQNMPDHLRKDRPVYAVQAKGIDGKESFHSSIEQMAGDYLREIREVQKEGPYYLLFYCYNAIAVEMATRLSAEGQVVNLLVIDSGVGPGTSFAEQSIRERAVRYLRKLSTTPLTTISNSIRSRYRAYIKNRYPTLSTDASLPLLADLKRQLDNNHDAYQWKTFDATCHLILAAQEHPELRKKLVASWEEWSDARVVSYINQGNHFNQFQEPQVATLGTLIEQIFDESARPNH